MRADPARWAAWKARHREYSRDRYAKREDVRAKASAYGKAYMADPVNRNKVNKRTREWAAANKSPQTWLKAALTQAKVRAKDKGVPFALTRADVDLPKRCPALGVVLNYLGGEINGQDAASLDRLRPELGYVPGNVRVVCRQANAMKNNASLAQHRQLVAWMEREMEPHRLHSEGIIF